MADKLSTLTKPKWDALKKNAGIASSGTLKNLFGQSANVGKAIDGYVEARKNWKAFKSTRVVASYVKSLDQLSTTFTKFMAIKEFKSDEAKDMKVAITEWRKACVDKKAKLLKFAQDNKDALKANDVAATIHALEASGLI